MKYTYNRGTKKLHILGGCGYSDNPKYDRYSSKEEVSLKTGADFVMCKYCLLKESGLKK